MRQYNYDLNIPALTGTNFNISFLVPVLTGSTELGITINSNNSLDNLKKIIFDYNDIVYTINNSLLSSIELNGKSVSYIFESSSTLITTYSVFITGVRANFTFDTMTLNISVLQPSISDMDFRIIKSSLFNNAEESDKVLITAEIRNPPQLVNFTI